MRRRRSPFDTRVCWLALVACACAMPEDLPEEDPDGGSGGSGGSAAGNGGKGGTAGSVGGGGKVSFAGSGTGGTPAGGSSNGGAPTAGSNTAGGNTAGSNTAGSSSAGKGGTGGGGTGGATAGAAGSAGKGGAGSGGTAGKGGSGGGSPSGTVLFTDDFEAGAGKWEPSGADWTVVADGATQVYQQGAKSNSFRMATANAGPWGDQIIEARMKIVSIVSGSTSYYAAIAGRVQDEDNFYYLAVRADGTLVIRARKGGSHANLSGSVATPIRAGAWHQLRLEIVGTAIRVSVDGTPTATFQDSAIAMGTVAFSNVNASVQYDDIRVTAP